MTSVPAPSPGPRGRAHASTAGLLLIALSWGFNWPAVKLALNEMPVWGMRAVGLSVGAALLLLLAVMSARPIAVARRDWPALVIAGLLNIAGFNVLTAYAQTLMPTSRAAILAYTMPLLASLLAWLFLGERLKRLRVLALALGGLGLLAVVAPLRDSLGEPGVQAGILSILGAALSWAAGTVYTKHISFTADPMATTTWQLAVGAAAAWIGVLAFELPLGATHAFWPTTAWSWGGLVYNSVLGIAFSYFLWFGMVARLPASTAAIGTLLVPVVGVTSAMAIIGDRPTAFDGIGFALIIAAVFLNIRADRH